MLRPPKIAMRVRSVHPELADRISVTRRQPELPGLGLIQFNLVEKSRKGIRLTAVRITLNPGESSKTVINLGNARTEIK